MEEILASIRQIIANDEPAQERAPTEAADPRPLRGAAPAAMPPPATLPPRTAASASAASAMRDEETDAKVAELGGMSRQAPFGARGISAGRAVEPGGSREPAQRQRGPCFCGNRRRRGCRLRHARPNRAAAQRSHRRGVGQRVDPADAQDLARRQSASDRRAPGARRDRTALARTGVSGGSNRARFVRLTSMTLSWPGLSRPSTSWVTYKKDVDARDTSAFTCVFRRAMRGYDDSVQYIEKRLRRRTCRPCASRSI
jgi:cell pole-organizing protein PopZ